MGDGRRSDEEDWQDCEDDSCATPSTCSPTSSGTEDDEFEVLDWKQEVRRGGSLQEVSLEKGTKGWASPPGSSFQVRGPNYFTKKSKVAGGDWLFKPLGLDWLKSSSRLDNVLGSSNNRVMKALTRAQSSGAAPHKAFMLAVNLQIPGKEHHSAVFYYVIEDTIPPGSLLDRFVHGEDDGFRNSRFKLINRVVRGPWLVRAAVGNHAACLLGKALTCRYVRGPNYLEIDVDIGSSTVANYILHLALGYVSSVTVDMAFLVEAVSQDELPERVMGAIRIAQIDMESAVHVEQVEVGGGGGVQASQEKSGALLTGGACATTPPCLQSNLSWKRLSRSLSLLAHHGNKAGKVDDEHTRTERTD